MRIGFLSNKLTLRGTEVCLYDYADCNERLLGNTSIVITQSYEDASAIDPYDVHPDAYAKFAARFPNAVHYYKTPEDVRAIVAQCAIDVLFIAKSGSPDDGLVFENVKTIVHAVFDPSRPHGTAFTVISDHLNRIHGTAHPVLPLMVRIHPTQADLRDELGVPRDATVFGTYSGRAEFSIPYVKRVVISLSRRYPQMYFLFMNIDPFCPELQNVRFLPGTADMERKRMFINTCDAMLYGRAGGETFGLACGEFALAGKPVLARAGERHNHHEQALGGMMIPHRNYYQLRDILINWSPRSLPQCTAFKYLEYTEARVMEKFAALLAT